MIMTEFFFPRIKKKTSSIVERLFGFLATPSCALSSQSMKYFTLLYICMNWSRGVSEINAAAFLHIIGN